MAPAAPSDGRPGEGLRARKKRRTRSTIADAAAALFAARGFDAVTVTDVARAAEVSEQTVYNYFPSKEHLVFDRNDEMEAALLARVRERGPEEAVIDGVRARAAALLDTLERIPWPAGRGGMPYLVAASPALRRWGLELWTATADSLARLLAEERGREDDGSDLRILARVLLTPAQVAIEDLGRRLVAGQSAAEAVAEIRPAVERAFAELARGLRPDPPGPGGPDPGGAAPGSSLQ